MRKLKLFTSALILGASLIMFNGTQAKAETFLGEIPDTNEAAQQISFNTSYESQFETTNDKDIYKITTSNNNSYYEFIVTNMNAKEDSVFMYINNDNGGNVDYVSAGEGNTNKIVLRLEPGKTYYLHMNQEWNKATSSYQFRVNEILDDYFQTNSEAAEIQLGKTYNCSFEASFDADYFKLTTTNNNSYYQFDLSRLTDTDDVMLFICRENNSTVDYISARDSKSIILKLEPNSIYYLHAEQRFSYGPADYKLTVTEILDDHNDDIRKATSIELSKEINGTFETSYDQDYVQFKTTKNNSFYKIEMTNQSQNDTYEVALYNEDYSWIENFTVGQSGRGSKIFNLDPNKTYYLKTNKYFQENGSSKYKLSVKEIKDDASDTFDKSSKLTLNTTSSYALQASQDVDYLSFKTNSGTTTYNITVSNSSSEGFNVNLYDSDNIHVGSMRVNGNSKNSMKYTLKKNKTYYLKVSDGVENAKYKVTVNGGYIKIKSLELSKKSATLKKGATLKLTAEYKPGNATVQSITWSTSNKNVATVNSKTGVVTAKKAGTVNITCTVKNYDGSVKKQVCKVTVK